MSNKLNIKINLKLVIMFLIVAISPLIAIYVYYEIPQYIVNMMHQGQNRVDIYLKGKSYILIFSGFLMFIYFILNIRDKDREILKSFSIEYYFTIALSILIALSTIFSRYKSIALFGFPDRFEGAIIWILYMGLILFVRLFYVEENEIESLSNMFKFSFIGVAIIGVFEYFGYYFLMQEWYKNIFTAGVLRGADFTAGYNYNKSITSTMYNPNFTGSFFAVATSFLLVMFIKEKKISKLNLFALILSFFNLIASDSSAGFVGFLAMFFLYLLISYKDIFKFKKKMIISLALLIGITSFVYIDANRKNIFTTEISSISNIEEVQKEKTNFENLNLKDNILEIKFSGKIFKMELVGSNVNFYDTNGNPLEYILYTEEQYLEFEHPDYEDIRIELLEGGQAFKYFHNDFVYYIGFEDGKLKVADEVGNIYDELGDVRSFGFENIETIGSSRGYIWSRSLPVLFDQKIIGLGADNFPFYFPQNDIVGKENFLSGSNAFVDKPHNMFIQMGISFGIIFLLVYFMMIIKYTHDSVKLYFNISSESRIKVIGLAAFMSIIAYNVAGFFNDSNLCTSPTYWAMFALGLAINSKLKLEKITSIEK